MVSRAGIAIDGHHQNIAKCPCRCQYAHMANVQEVKHPITHHHSHPELALMGEFGCQIVAVEELGY
jgi:hypothetical protein